MNIHLCRLNCPRARETYLNNETQWYSIMRFVLSFLYYTSSFLSGNAACLEVSGLSDYRIISHPQQNYITIFFSSLEKHGYSCCMTFSNTMTHCSWLLHFILWSSSMRKYEIFDHNTIKCWQYAVRISATVFNPSMKTGIYLTINRKRYITQDWHS